MTAVEIADFACVPMAGDAGTLVRIGQWANGDGFQDYQHVLGYAGYFIQTPDPGLRKGKPVIIVGTGPGHYVIEAMPGGARMRRLAGTPEEYPGALWSSGRILLTDVQRSDINAAAWGYLGTPYSAADYFELAAHHLHLPGDSLLRDSIANSGHMICSQYWDKCYQDGGVQLFNDKRWNGDVVPLDMAHRIEAG